MINYPVLNPRHRSRFDHVRIFCCGRDTCKVTHQQCDPSWQSLYCVFLEKLTICFDFETYEKSPVLSYIGSRSFALSTEEMMLQGSSRWGLTGSSQCITYHEGKVYFQGVNHLTISEWVVPENSAVSLNPLDTLIPSVKPASFYLSKQLPLLLPTPFFSLPFPWILFEIGCEHSLAVTSVGAPFIGPS